MAYSIVLKKQVHQSLLDAMDWYEGQSAGLSLELSTEFYDTLQKLADNPHRHILLHEMFRRILMKRFPYKIVFAIDEPRQRVVVVAFWHVKRNPEALKKLLKK